MHFDEDKAFCIGILKSVLGARRNISRLILAQLNDFIPVGHGYIALNHYPVFAAMRVGLKAEACLGCNLETSSGSCFFNRSTVL